MNLLNRIYHIFRANLNSALEPVQPPEFEIKKLLAEIEELHLRLRREAVRAVTCEKQYAQQIGELDKQTEIFEQEAREALEKKNELKAQEAISKKIHLQPARMQLENEFKQATRIATQLKQELALLETQLEKIQQKGQELERRKNLVENQLGSWKSEFESKDIGTVDKFNDLTVIKLDNLINKLEEEIVKLESQVEANREIYETILNPSAQFDKYLVDQSVNDELAKLKKRLLKERES